MNRAGFMALLIGAVLLYVFFHVVFDIEAFAFFYVFFIKVIAFAKGFIARLTWEAVLLFGTNFFKRATVKFLFIQVPMTLALPVLTILFMKPRTKRRWKARVERIKRAVIGYYTRTRTWFDHRFGVNGLLAFVCSLTFAISSFVASMYFFGFEFFFWIGSWGPIGRLARWVWGWITYVSSFTRGVVYRLPMVGTIIGLLGSFWKQTIAPRLPRVEGVRKRIVKQSLKTARNSREHSLRVYMRYERKRERRKERAQQKKKQYRELTFARLMWVGGTTPRWDRIGFRSDEYHRLFDRAMHDSSERLYIDAYLGGTIKPTLLEGGDVSWRQFRH